MGRIELIPSERSSGETLVKQKSLLKCPRIEIQYFTSISATSILAKRFSNHAPQVMKRVLYFRQELEDFSCRQVKSSTSDR